MDPGEWRREEPRRHRDRLPVVTHQLLCAQTRLQGKICAAEGASCKVKMKEVGLLGLGRYRRALSPFPRLHSLEIRNKIYRLRASGSTPWPAERCTAHGMHHRREPLTYRLDPFVAR